VSDSKSIVAAPLKKFNTPTTMKGISSCYFFTFKGCWIVGGSDSISKKQIKRWRRKEVLKI
jgi:hypothetical protein